MDLDGPGSAYMSQSLKCSRCDAIFANLTSCKKHCNHPSTRCNRGKAPEDSARVIPVGILFRETDGDYGGSRMCRVASGVNDKLHDDHDPAKLKSWKRNLKANINNYLHIF